MNKKEVLEIRKQFTAENCCLTRIRGCYIDHEGERLMEMDEAFLSLPEEEMFKYLDIFKKSLSGGLGKNLLNLGFPLAEEGPGGAQEFLVRLKESKLDDDMLVSEFYDKVSGSYVTEGNYFIILAHGVYDVPGKGSDGADMYDASDTVYEHVLCCVCPVALAAPALSYDGSRMRERSRDWVVGVPEKAFLFPAFNDRGADIHGALYYTKSPKELQPEFLLQVLGVEAPMPADAQREAFTELVEAVLGEDIDYRTVRDIHDNLNDLIEEHKDEAEPLELSELDIRKVFEASGVPEESMGEFGRAYGSAVGEARLVAENVTDTAKLKVEAPDVCITVKPERMDLVESRVIDGRQCLVVMVDGTVEVNGVAARTVKPGN